MAFKGLGLFETEEAEAARLAESPVGSTNHRLSTMPIQILANVQDMLIELPRFGDKPDHTIVVVPIDSHPFSGADAEERPRRRYQITWTCAVIASDHPSYPVGGYRVSIPEYELRRGVQRTLGL